MSVPVLPGITAKTITSKRLTTRVLFSGQDDGIPVLFIHGNLSSATFWEENMLALPSGYRGIALDQRGYGEADLEKKIDATRGLRDFSDDAAALLDTLGIEKAHIVGHSLGGSVCWQLMRDYAARLLTVTVVAPGSPYGFGGVKGENGESCYSDHAGSGAGIVNPTFVELVAAGDRSTDNPQLSPRVIINNFYWKPPFVPVREEDLLSSMLSIHTGEQGYAGDKASSENWPMVAPGKFGPNNALSPGYAGDVSELYRIEPKPPVLWVRGADDQIVGDNSLFDMGTLGALGAVPGWPGADIFPPQPMISQTRAVLNQYKDAGGQFVEEVFADTGHTPFIEKPEIFNEVFHQHLQLVK
ncbi:MAG: alpha/beta hydrolase [Chitinophagaceae bacterium]|nr:alpha/beta hydrolase [Anaerolineae bacterium]